MKKKIFTQKLDQIVIIKSLLYISHVFNFKTIK
jgi:hypothetical protein